MTKSEKQVFIDAIADGVPNPASRVRSALQALIDGAYSYEVREFDVPTSFITENFDPTGLGTGEWIGWAICNGNNGTRNRGGRVSMQYNSTYPTLGAVLGEATHVLTSNEIPSVNVSFTGSNADNGDNGTYIITAATQSNGTKTLTTSGGGQAHNIIQPTIVSLYLMKLPE